MPTSNDVRALLCKIKEAEAGDYPPPLFLARRLLFLIQIVSALLGKFPSKEIAEHKYTDHNTRQ
jgi:hypothetical protein